MTIWNKNETENVWKKRGLRIAFIIKSDKVRLNHSRFRDVKATVEFSDSTINNGRVKKKHPFGMVCEIGFLVACHIHFRCSSPQRLSGRICWECRRLSIESRFKLCHLGIQNKRFDFPLSLTRCPMFHPEDVSLEIRVSL